MICKTKIAIIPLIALLLLSFSAACVAAQYLTEKTSNVTIPSNGTYTASEADIGVYFTIQGTPSATGTVTTSVYNGNPQPTAAIPNGITLAHFVAVTFNMNSNDFIQAQISITYTDSEVQNIQPPYSIYKYLPNSNSYVEVPFTVGNNAKTFTVTLTSNSDPLLAIGALAKTNNAIQASTWIIITISAIAILLLAVFIVTRIRQSDKSEHPNSEQNTGFSPKAQPSNINAENKPQTAIPKDLKIENQIHDEFKAIGQNLDLKTTPQPPKIIVEKKQQSLTTKQNVSFLPKETPKPQLPNIDAKNKPQTAIQNKATVKPTNINTEKRTQTDTSQKKKNKKQ